MKSSESRKTSLPHSIAEIRDSLICGCDPQIFSAGEHGDDCPIVLFDGLVEQFDALLKVAEGLFQMIDRETWRATGGDDQQGHYEGDYRAAQIEEYLMGLRASNPASEGVAARVVGDSDDDAASTLSDASPPGSSPASDYEQASLDTFGADSSPANKPKET